MTTCKNCNHLIDGHYCSNCGQATILPKINKNYLTDEVKNILNLESGFLFTVRVLLTNPGENIRIYLTENRSRLVKPVLFIIITSLFYSLVNKFFHFEDSYLKFQDDHESSAGIIFSWVQQNYGYANIIMGMFIAFWTNIIFRKYGYNYYEILILMCYAMGIQMLIFSFSTIAQEIIKVQIMQIAGMAGISYCAWAIAHFFDKHKAINYLKAILVYFLGMSTAVLTAIFSGKVLDLIF